MANGRQNSLLEFMSRGTKKEQTRQNSRRRKSKTVVYVPSDSETGDDSKNNAEDITDSESDDVKKPARKRQKSDQLGPRPVTPAIPKLNSEPWVDKYRPKDINEVAIHAKKLQDIRNEFSKLADTSNDDVRLLIVSGPAGSAKSTVIQHLAREYGVSNTVEWASPDKTEGVSLTEAFGDFLSGFRIPGGRPNTMILVEDLPNITHFETKREFANALMEWVSVDVGRSYKFPPLVLIITEVEPVEANSWTDAVVTERILPRRLLEHERVRRIKTQPTNATLTTKVLKHIASQEKVKVPVKDLNKVIKEIASYGDIRSSITSLEFWARWRSQSSIMEPLGRESHLNLFHAIGRVVYGSSKDKYGNPLRSDSEVIESVLHDWENTNRDATMTLSIHENFPAAHSSRLDLQCSNECAQWLSDSDLLVAKDMSLFASDLSVRGVRTAVRSHNPDERRPKLFRQTVYPREKKLNKAKNKSVTEIDSYILYKTQQTKTICSRATAALLDGYYESVVKPGTHRVTGRIGNDHITAESTIDEDEDLVPKLFTLGLDEPGEQETGLTLTDDDIEDSSADEF